MERSALDKAFKTQRMQLEIGQARRENDFYLEQVEKAKTVNAIVAKKRDRAERDHDEDQARLVDERQRTAQRSFRQKKIIKAPE